MTITPETIQSVLTVAGDVVGCAAIVAAALPHPSEKANVIIKILRGCLDVIAANIGNATNSQKDKT